MILYSLCCEKEHGFDSWFRDSAAYEQQKAQGLVACPVCGSAEVEKALMAPALGSGTRKREPEPEPTAALPAEKTRPEKIALLSEREQALRAMIRAVREQVTQNSDYVGEEFATLARQMHEGEVEQRSIYGEASAEEVRSLIEDEIEVLPLPNLPDERN
ncbi:DUF1178 family protein [Ancylobacter oerskovii]|uniref:DUF1178 family protein n=1 Tax=Ancylobacter oerskovii TaxID=459519 RepID=A0ABW4YRP8_9HYPH|nr:DUF1178 family protein [Ancylobacter oerskovii]MBS7545398.1 DUF1178 family protein [Ancylobacter oerskovii]